MTRPQLILILAALAPLGVLLGAHLIALAILAQIPGAL